MLNTAEKVENRKWRWWKLLKEKGPNYVRQFSEMTTLHGVRYLGEKNRCLLERVFWALAMLVTYSSCWYFVALVSSDYYTTPVVMSVETRATSSWSIPSPAVTVCTSSHISHAKVDVQALVEQTNRSSTMEARLDVIRNLCGNINGKADYLDDDAIYEVINNYLPDVRHVFVSVTRMHKNIEPLSEHLQTIITPSSICFVHNMLPLDSFLRPEFLDLYTHYGLVDNKTERTVWTPDLGYQNDRYDALPMRLWGNGFTSSTKYLLSVRELDYDARCSFNMRALSVYFHNPAEIPWRVHSNIFLETNYRVVVFITPVVTRGYVNGQVYAEKPHTLNDLEVNSRRVIAGIRSQLSERRLENWTSRLRFLRARHGTDDVVKVWNPVKRGCYFEKERYLRYFLIYTQRNCERECDSNNTFTNCGCVLLSHPRNISMPVCGPNKLSCVEKSQSQMIKQEMRLKGSANCQCLPSCNEIDFSAEAHWRPWQFNINSSYAAVPGRVDLNNTAISLMAIAVKKKYLNKTKRTALMGSAAYVASIGGILSLFLGISVLSLFEVVYFMTLRAMTNIWNMRKREHLQEQDQDRFWAYHVKKHPFIP